MKDAKLISQDIIFDKYGKKFVNDNLILNDGTSTSWAYLSGVFGVIIVAIDKNKNLILVRQYRYTRKDFTYECPAGAKDKNEDSLDTAKRELFEESGYKSQKFVNLGNYFTLSTDTDHQCQIFLATDCEFVSPPTLDEDMEKYTGLNTELQPFIDVINSLGQPDSLIKDTEQITAIFLAHHYLLEHNLL